MQGKRLRTQLICSQPSSCLLWLNLPDDKSFCALSHEWAGLPLLLLFQFCSGQWHVTVFHVKHLIETYSDIIWRTYSTSNRRIFLSCACFKLWTTSNSATTVLLCSCPQRCSFARKQKAEFRDTSKRPVLAITAHQNRIIWFHCGRVRLEEDNHFFLHKYNSVYVYSYILSKYSLTGTITHVKSTFEVVKLSA